MPKRPKYPTYHTILAYIREKLEGRRQVAIAEALHGKGSRKSYVHSLTGDAAVNGNVTQPEVPAAPMAPNVHELATMIAANTIAALNGQGRPPRKTGDNKRGDNGRKKPKFFFRGC